MKKTKIIPKCEKCCFWSWPEDNFVTTTRGSVEAEGICRRYPPVHISNIGFRAPTTAADWGCGEWKARRATDERD